MSCPPRVAYNDEDFVSTLIKFTKWGWVNAASTLTIPFDSVAIPAES